MMNERIKELAIQAGYLPDNFGIGHWDMPECKKFAELIILECATLVDSAFDINEHSGEVVSYADGSQLKEHFGVEE